KFVAEDLDDIDVEISVAKQSLKRDNKYEPEQKD
ncbi:5-bromo-4-chloroindolyl phosphate hydrolysis protein, partial [Enterococcus faecalis]